MIIGIPRERKTLERRVALTPAGARVLIAHGHSILVERKAGEGSFFEDHEYQEAGCRMVSSLAQLWKEAELIVKVKEPHEEEYAYFRSDLAIFSYLHLAGLPEVAEAMLRGQITGIAYELVRGSDSTLPLLEPMSEVAGRLSVLIGSYFLLTQNGGRGVLLGQVGEMDPGRVVILGAGTAGRAACASAVGIGARVAVLDINDRQLARVRAAHGDKVTCLRSSPHALAEQVAEADLLIGAVLVPGARAPQVISRADIARMPRGAVFVDISVDQGGCAETTRPTTLRDPIYTEEGVIHYAVQNMPSMTARSSTQALTEATLPYIVMLADRGIREACLEMPEITPAVCTYRGRMTEPHVALALKLPVTDVKELL